MNVRSKYNILIQTAISSIAHNGIENFNMKQLTQSANVATGTCYHYFKGKDDLLIATANYIYADLEGVLANLEQETDFKTGFTKLFLALCNFFKSKSNYFYAAKALNNYKVVLAYHKKNKSEFKAALERFLERGILENKLSYLPLELVVAMFMSNVYTTVAYQTEKELLPDPTLDEKLTLMVWNQLKAN